MPTFDPSDLIGRTFLLPPEENGERHRTKVTRQVVEELISYNQLLEHLENAQDHDMRINQKLYRF